MSAFVKLKREHDEVHVQVEAVTGVVFDGVYVTLLIEGSKERFYQRECAPFLQAAGLECLMEKEPAPVTETKSVSVKAAAKK